MPTSIVSARREVVSALIALPARLPRAKARKLCGKTMKYNPMPRVMKTGNSRTLAIRIIAKSARPDNTAKGDWIRLAMRGA